MNDFEKRHFRAWANSGHCPIEVSEDPEEALEKVESFLDSLASEIERDYWTDSGWRRVWEQVA